MALLLANQRWEPEPTRPDYAADALRLFALLRAKVVSSGGIVGDVTNSFDSKTKLPYAEPDNGGAQYSRTSLVMPGYYDIWASVTGDSFFTDAAAAGREFLSIAAHPSTGLYPREAYFDGSPKEDRSEFSAESYRVDFNLAIDKLWGTPSSAQVGYEQKSAANMLAFFTEKGLTTYDASYSIDGKNVLITGHVGELEMANAALATIASTVSLAERQAFLQAAWNQPIPDGVYRYYKGIFYLLGNLIICGQYRVCP
jgi:endo-1,4-beta-D-glucanase Y